MISWSSYSFPPVAFSAIMIQTVMGNFGITTPGGRRPKGSERGTSPTAFADWFHDKIVEWSDSAPNGHATQHVISEDDAVGLPGWTCGHDDCH